MNNAFFTMIKRKRHYLLSHVGVPVLLGSFLFAVLLISIYGICQSSFCIAFDSIPPNFTKDLFTSPLAGDNVILHGSRYNKEIALTFDADMNEYMKSLYESGQVTSYYDPYVVNTLIQKKTKATFFLTGMWIELYPQQTKSFASNPLFELENHSYNHPSFDGYCYGLPQISDSQDRSEVEKTQKLLKDIAGVDNTYFRFPGGCYSRRDVRIIEKLGFQVVHWDVVSGDAFNNDAAAIVQNVITHVKNGSIIIMHLNGPPNAPQTAQALPIIIDQLRQKGFIFVKVSELLNN